MMRRVRRGNGTRTRALVKAPRPLPEEIKQPGPDGKDLIFISTDRLISPVPEIRVELVYKLTRAKILREAD